ncbi:uncharacterized protein LOC120717183 [Simochromis diagramma]|uniref:uncharacterized protein LOC120717183 n=1 Tax=Simochromis diagramma TaxID=43689 RepID=UPI001A7E7A43|nr:uncharacterized protein LOC120717183 [Simochromis diagramma]
MQPSFFSSEDVSESTRPRRQVQPPPYLADYEVSLVGHQRDMTPYRHSYTAQYAPGLEERKQYVPSAVSVQTSRSSSPTSQPGWEHAVDEWTASPNDLQDMRQHVPSRDGLNHQPPSPFHRPWEMSAVSGSQYGMNGRPQPYAQTREPDRGGYLSEQRDQRSPPTHVPPLSSSQRMQPISVPTISSHTHRIDARTSPWPQYDNRQDIHAQQEYQRPYFRPPSAQSIPPKDTTMIDTLDRMMGELQLLKEQTLTASRPTPPFPNSAPSFRFEHPPIIPQHLKPPWQEQFPARAYPSFQSQAPTNIWSQQPVAEVSRPITTSSQYKPHPSPANQPPHVMAKEKTYRGPTPSIPDLIKKDPSELPG